MNRLFLALSAMACALAFNSAGAGPAAPWLRNPYSVSFHLDNDLFVNTDRYYTNGMRLSILSKDIEAMDLPPWAERVYDWLPVFGRPGYTNNIGFAIGQNMYTPRDIAIAEPQPDDHPWGGWLYADLSLHHKNERNLHKLSLQLGIVGPDSFAEDSQRIIHTLRDFDLPQGWDNQIGTEPGIRLTYTYKNRLATFGNPRGFGADLIPDIGASLGNIRTEASIGTTLRAGWRVPLDFQSLRIDESGYAMAQEGELEGGWKSFSVYAFGGLRGHAVAHDIFLDGNTFRDSPSVSRKPWVGAAEVGVGLRWGPCRLVYVHVMRTKEFDEAESGQKFGSVNFSYFF
jgi:hypothetical protein